MVGRWQSGAPLASPRSGRPRPRRATRLATTTSSTATTHAASDVRPAHTPGAPTRAMPWTDEGSVDVRLHRMIRRGTSYGPMLPDGVLDDDGVDRGIMFVFAGAHLGRQFEFVKTQWLNDGIFIGAPSREGPARRRRTTAPARSRSRDGRSAGDCRTCRPSSSPAAASTASRRACERCDGSPS